ncbi:hypothetical protein MMC25_004799 [Agyrium rufum]|nr:hypothetical protein [Agyrium rufum]
MYVGDGTWDSQRNTFLLPNLVGLNFKTMQYNGMGNRFLELPQYHTLIKGHGVIAAIVFLGIVPAAIMINRFYLPFSPMALRYHIWLQILTVLLTTVIFVLGYFAVGPERSLTNPHHGIGLAIYVLVLVQFIGGWWVHSRERRKRQPVIPLKVVLHKWFGRMIALLGLAQIPLGLTLYGSPVVLFVLYALAVFALLVIYFILSYMQERDYDRDRNSDYSYASGSAVVPRRSDHRFRHAVEGAAVGGGLAALANRFRKRRRDDDVREDEVVGSRLGSRRHSGSFVEEDKLEEYENTPKRSRLRGRLLEVGALAGAAGIATRLFGRKKRTHVDGSDIDPYGPDGRTDITEDTLEQVEEGRRPIATAPLADESLGPGPGPGPGQVAGGLVGSAAAARPHSHRRSHSSMSYESYGDGSPQQRRSHKLRDGVAALGAFGFAREMLARRRKRKEERRAEALRQQDLEEEQIARRDSQRYTGDGTPRRHRHRGSLTTSTAYSDEIPRRDTGIPPPIPSGAAVPLAGTAAMAAAERERLQSSHQNLAPPPPLGGSVQDMSGSEIYSTTSGRRLRRHHSGRDAAAAGLAGAAAGGLAAETISDRRDRSRRRSEAENLASPPVSVKVKMHNDGRSVTLRRLPQEEAAAIHESRNRSGSRRRRRQAGSVSSFSGTDTGRERWRRTEALERQQAAEMEQERRAAIAGPAAAAANNDPILAQYPPPPPIAHGGDPRYGSGPPPPAMSSSRLNVPPPPPIPGPSSPPQLRPGTGSVGSPGTYDGTVTEASTDFASNRRRRRAERQANKAAAARGEFE